MTKLFLDQTQIIGRKIRPQDLKGCDFDTVRQGYWIESDSPQAVWLTLKGLNLRRLYYNPDNIPPKIPNSKI
jgi:hypothetical protein